jgi:FtsP/CotA-like multicopper oxidase with cupredoxin domain
VILPVAASLRYDLEFKMPEHGAVKLVNTDETGFTGNFFTKLLGFSAPSADSAHRMLTAAFGTGESPSTTLAQLQNKPQFDFTSYGSPITAQDNLTLDATFTRQFKMELGNALGFFNGGFTMKFLINQKAFPDIPTYRVKTGDLVKINIINNSDIPHPMHIHGHSMKILSKDGKPLTGSPVYLSTLLVSSHESYEVAFVADNPGLWMIHCHNLGHAANGMDMMLNYEGVTTTYAVGSKTGNYPD